MRVVNYSGLRGHLKQELDRVISDSDITVVSRNGEGNNVVIMSEESYLSMAETDYLLQSPANRKSLMTSIKQLEKGELVRINPLKK